MGMLRNWGLATGVMAAGVLGGCGPVSSTHFTTEDRMSHGMVIVLPGIEGEGLLSYEIRGGLDKGGVDQGIPIYRWGRPIPLLGLLINQIDAAGNRAVAVNIAKMIVEYQDAHPGKPVHLVGHSGGGGVAVFTAESLPPGYMIDGIVLLNASIAGSYDLAAALAKTRKGIVNFYSPADVGLLIFGTTLVGTVDGSHEPSAGAVGFKHQYTQLHQVKWNISMIASGNLGGHVDVASRSFVSKWVAPWVTHGNWRTPELMAMAKP